MPEFVEGCYHYQLLEKWFCNNCSEGASALHYPLLVEREGYSECPRCKKRYPPVPNLDMYRKMTKWEDDVD